MMYCWNCNTQLPEDGDTLYCNDECQESYRQWFASIKRNYNASQKNVSWTKRALRPNISVSSGCSWQIQNTEESPDRSNKAVEEMGQELSQEQEAGQEE